MPIGPLELGIVLLIVLLIFGPKKLPGLGKQLGTGMREFKDSITGKDKADADSEADAPALPPAPAVTTPAAVPPPPEAAPAAAEPQAEDRPAAGA